MVRTYKSFELKMLYNGRITPLCLMHLFAGRRTKFVSKLAADVDAIEEKVCDWIVIITS